MGKDIQNAERALQELWPLLRDAYASKHPNRNLFLVHVDRSPVEQLRLFCQGRLPEHPGQVVTYCDGYNKKSRHNATPLSQAIDVGVMDGGRVVWDEEYFHDIGAIIFALGFSGEVEWGGDWRFKDWGHIQTR